MTPTAQRPTPSLRGFVTLALATAALMSPSLVAAQSTEARVHLLTMATDLANRSSAIHWPAGYDPATAGIFTHSEVLINASCARVWRHIIEPAAWPTWYPNASDVQLAEPGATELRQDSVFHWKTFGQPLESRVHELVPTARLGWYGSTPGRPANFYHTFLLTPNGEDCQVVTEELGNGPVAAYMRKADEGMIHRGHELWLAALKWKSEQ